MWVLVFTLMVVVCRGEEIYSYVLYRLFGYFLRTQFVWLIVNLDFSEAVPTQCVYPDDYITWIPSDGVSHTLLHTYDVITGDISFHFFFSIMSSVQTGDVFWE